MDICHAGFRDGGGDHSFLLVQCVRTGGDGAQDFHGRHGEPDAGLHPEFLRGALLHVRPGDAAGAEGQPAAGVVQCAAGAVSGRGAGGAAACAQQAAAVPAGQDAHPS